jgi:hypothetical protein
MKIMGNDLQTIVNMYQLWIGIVLGWVLTRIMEMFRKPRISFEPSNDSEFIRGNKKFKFINVTVKNAKQNLIKKFFFGNSSLNNARARLVFKDFTANIEILKLDGRWASTKEPVDYVSGQPLIPEILIPSRDSVPPGEETTVSVAIKESGEDSFFAFNNDSYLHNWKNPDYELQDDKYCLEIHLLDDCNEYVGRFLFSNPSKILRNFKIIKQ